MNPLASMGENWPCAATYDRTRPERARSERAPERHQVLLLGASNDGSTPCQRVTWPPIVPADPRQITIEQAGAALDRAPVSSKVARGSDRLSGQVERAGEGAAPVRPARCSPRRRSRSPRGGAEDRRKKPPIPQADDRGRCRRQAHVQGDSSVVEAVEMVLTAMDGSVDWSRAKPSSSRKRSGYR